MAQKEEEGREERREKKEGDEEEEEEEEVPGSTLFIKNLNFSTTEEKLQEVSDSRCVSLLEEVDFLQLTSATLFLIPCRRSLNAGRFDRAPSPRKRTKQV